MEREIRFARKISIWVTVAALTLTSGKVLEKLEGIRTSFEGLPSPVRGFIVENSAEHFVGVSHIADSSNYTIFRMRFTPSGGVEGKPGVEIIRDVFDSDGESLGMYSGVDFRPVSNFEEGMEFISSAPENFGDIIAFSPPIPKPQSH